MCKKRDHVHLGSIGLNWSRRSFKGQRGWGFRVGSGLGLRGGRRRGWVSLSLLEKEVCSGAGFLLIEVMLFKIFFFLVCICLNKYLSHLLTRSPLVTASALPML